MYCSTTGKIVSYVLLIGSIFTAFIQQGFGLEASLPPDDEIRVSESGAVLFSEVDVDLPAFESTQSWFIRLGEVWFAGPYEKGGTSGEFEIRVYRDVDDNQSRLSDNAIRFVELGRFDAPGGMHAATAVLEGDSLWLLGGHHADEFFSTVHRLSWDGDQVDIQRRPDLPAEVAYGGAAILDGFLYYVGGLSDSPLGLVNEGLWRLSLDDESDVGSWEILEPMPQGGRVLPTVFSHYGQLNVVGGLVPHNDTFSPTSSNWIYRENAVDGTLKRGWIQRSNSPVQIAAAAVYKTGQNHAALIGGYESQIMAQDLFLGSVPGDAFASGVWLTHLITDTWVKAGESPFGLPPGTVSIDENHVRWYSPSLSDSYLELTLHRELKQLVAADYLFIFLYFALMAGIGVWFAKRQKDSDEFALGGRQVIWWASGVSMFATGASSISFMAIPAIAFGSNLVWLAPIVVFMVPAFFLQGYLIYPLLRKLNLTSTFAYLEQRYGLPLRMLASFQAIAFQLLGRMSVVMLLPSMAISAVTGLDVVTSVILMGVLTTIYTTFGGFEAVIWTDVLQGGMMILGCIIMIVVSIFSLSDGVSGFIETSHEHEKFMYAIWELDWVYPVFWVSVLTFLFQQIGFAADQPVIQRVYATPTADIKKLAAMAAFCGLLIAILTNVTGLSLFAYFQDHPEDLDPAMSMDQVVPLFIVQKLPIGVAGLIVAAIFAASMSTLSSSMNSVATLVGEDFYRRFYPNATDRGRLRIMKLASLCTGAIGTGSAWYMAELEITSMFVAWNIVFALLGGGFLGIYILGMFTTRTHAVGVVAGALASIASTIWIKDTNVHWLMYTPSAVMVCVTVGYLASICVPGAVKDLNGLTVFTTKASDG